MSCHSVVVGIFVQMLLQMHMCVVMSVVCAGRGRTCSVALLMTATRLKWDLVSCPRLKVSLKDAQT